MYVHRAISTCPRCNYSIEIWYHKSKIEPSDTIKCYDCDTGFVLTNFVTQLLDLRLNITPSSIETAKEITLLLQ